MVLAPVTDVLVPNAIASFPVVAAPEPIEIERSELDRTEAPCPTAIEFMACTLLLLPTARPPAAKRPVSAFVPRAILFSAFVFALYPKEIELAALSSTFAIIPIAILFWEDSPISDSLPTATPAVELDLILDLLPNAVELVDNTVVFTPMPIEFSLSTVA